MGPAAKAAYSLSQTSRVAWYVGQFFLASRLYRRTAKQAASAQPARTHRQAQSGRQQHQSDAPTTRSMLRELRVLMQQDLRNVEAGFYRLPGDLVPDPMMALSRARLFLDDFPAVQQRRSRRGGGAEVFRRAPAGTELLPRYYRQNFHYQTDGYLSARSANLYDHQVEVLFGGGADAMRRHALVPLADVFRSRPVRTARLLDIGAGTGRFLTSVKENYPRLDVTALDLSPYYLAKARDALAPWAGSSHVVQGQAEALPFPDGHFNVVTSIYLFHELPRKIRLHAAAEMARVLGPGGTLVLMDSLQKGDRPELDNLLEGFPQLYYEPYYAEYTRSDISGLFSLLGLTLESQSAVFLSKLWHFRKPAEN